MRPPKFQAMQTLSDGAQQSYDCRREAPAVAYRRRNARPRQGLLPVLKMARPSPMATASKT